MVPEVFLEPRESREAAKASPEVAREEKPLVTLDLNLTFTNTLAVKRVKLIINKGSNGNFAITRVCKNINQSEPEG